MTDEEKKEKVDKLISDIKKSPILLAKDQLMVEYYDGKEKHQVIYNIDHKAISVWFEKGYVIISNGEETKCCIKGTHFIGMWVFR